MGKSMDLKERAKAYADRFFEERLGNTGARCGYEQGWKDGVRYLYTVMIDDFREFLKDNLDE
jgi:hypothetical protein